MRTRNICKKIMPLFTLANLTNSPPCDTIFTVEALNKGKIANSGVGAADPQIVNRKSSIVNPLAAPRGITVQQAAVALRYSTASIRRLIAEQVLVAWKPAGPRGRKWLIDEVSLSRLQAALIDRARSHAAPTQQALLQGELPLW